MYIYFSHFIESPLLCAIFFLLLPSDVALSLRLGLPFGSSGVGNHGIEEWKKNLYTPFNMYGLLFAKESIYVYANIVEWTKCFGILIVRNTLDKYVWCASDVCMDL
jgi:hypothetical protein